VYVLSTHCILTSTHTHTLSHTSQSMSSLLECQSQLSCVGFVPTALAVGELDGVKDCVVVGDAHGRVHVYTQVCICVCVYVNVYVYVYVNVCVCVCVCGCESG